MKTASHSELMLNIQHNGIHILPDIVHSCCPNFDVRGQFGCQNIDTRDRLQDSLYITISPY